MTETFEKAYDINAFYTSNRTRWILSILVATGLNVGLFILMPALISSKTPQVAVEILVPQISIARIPEQVKKKPVEPPAPVQTETNKVIKRTVPAPQQRPVRKLSLPFAINPRLPSLPTSLDLPAPETTFNFDAASDNIFPAAQLDAPLTTLVRIPPIYPLRARQRGIEGWVKVRFLVDEQGSVSQVTLLDSHPEGLFDKSVQRCVSGWKFKPGTIEGVAVTSQVETTINFELE